MQLAGLRVGPSQHRLRGMRLRRSGGNDCHNESEGPNPERFAVLQHRPAHALFVHKGPVTTALVGDHNVAIALLQPGMKPGHLLAVEHDRVLGSATDADWKWRGLFLNVAGGWIVPGKT